MILELAIKIRESNRNYESNRIKVNKLLYLGKVTLTVMTVVGFLVSMILAIVTANQEKNPY